MKISVETLEIAKLIIAIIGGIAIAWYWNQRKHTLEQYRYLDNIYHDLLGLYQDKPHFGNPNITDNYTDNWQGEDALRYHYFAMTVHTVMETIFDLYQRRIPDEWAQIFRYHTQLHASWLQNNQNANRTGYVQIVLTGRAETQI